MLNDTPFMHTHAIIAQPKKEIKQKKYGSRGAMYNEQSEVVVSLQRGRKRLEMKKNSS